MDHLASFADKLEYPIGDILIKNEYSLYVGSCFQWAWFLLIENMSLIIFKIWREIAL